MAGRGYTIPVVLLLSTLLFSAPLQAEEFSFDLAAFEKQPLEWRGYAELRYEHVGLNQESPLYAVNYAAGEESEQHLNGALELSGDYRMGDTRLSGIWHGTVEDESREGLLYEGYINHKESSNFSWDLGKRLLKWGKGYAWNPVDFVARPKDPTDPEQGREGYVVANMDWIKSGDGALKTIGFTPVLLPVRDDINDDFGKVASNNLAAKLYLFYRGVDIDLMFLSNGARPGRIGADFSLNIASHIELHGEWSYIPDNPKKIIVTGVTTTEYEDSHSYLLGMRYLTESNTTWIIEYLHQDHGYTTAQMNDYFQQLEISPQPDNLIALGKQASYLRVNPMRDYLYIRASQKEPFGWIYTSLSLSGIKNIEDGSYMLMPEFAYTGLESMELRVRLTTLAGANLSEYGEKLNKNRIEARIRYFF